MSFSSENARSPRLPHLRSVRPPFLFCWGVTPTKKKRAPVKEAPSLEEPAELELRERRRTASRRRAPGHQRTAELRVRVGPPQMLGEELPVPVARGIVILIVAVLLLGIGVDLLYTGLGRNRAELPLVEVDPHPEPLRDRAQVLRTEELALVLDLAETIRRVLRVDEELLVFRLEHPHLLVRLRELVLQAVGLLDEGTRDLVVRAHFALERVPLHGQALELRGKPRARERPAHTSGHDEDQGDPHHGPDVGDRAHPLLLFPLRIVRHCPLLTRFPDFNADPI